MDFFCDRNQCQFSLYSRVHSLLESRDWSDCTFVVGDQRFPVHRLILSISSPVFQAMLYGPLSQTGDIVVEDIQPDTFRMMINYIYTDEISINNIEEAFSLLYASKKYMIEYLVEKSQIFISENVSIDNAFTVFKLAAWLQEPNLYRSSINLICQHADIVLENDLMEIPAVCLKAVLQSDKVNTTEFNLFKITFLWAHYYCIKHNLEQTPENKKKILKETGMLQQLRIFCLTHSEFNMLQELSHFLTASEITIVSEALLKLDQTKVLSTVSIPDYETFSFDVTLSPRKQIDLQWFLCRRALVRSSKPITVTNSTNIINVKIKCSKTVFIRSFAIPTQMAPNLKFKDFEELYRDYRENIDITIYSDSETDEKMNTKYNNKVQYNSTAFIDLPKPMKCSKDEWYNITFKWNTSSSSLTYPVSYRHLTWNHKVLFTFQDDECSVCPTFLEGLKFCM